MAESRLNTQTDDSLRRQSHQNQTWSCSLRERESRMKKAPVSLESCCFLRWGRLQGISERVAYRGSFFVNPFSCALLCAVFCVIFI